MHLVNAAAPAMRKLLSRVAAGQITPDEAIDVLLAWPDLIPIGIDPDDVE